MEPWVARQKGVPFPQPRKARARCPRDSRRDAGATVFFPQGGEGVRFANEMGF
jgi:hypothetical protein